MQRLFMDSATIYRMPVPYERDELVQVCKEVIRANNSHERRLHKAGRVSRLWRNRRMHRKPIIRSTSPSPRGNGAPTSAPKVSNNGVDVCISSWQRVAPNTIPALAKAGGNYLSEPVDQR